MLEIVNALATGALHLTLVTVLIGPFIWWSARRRRASVGGQRPWPRLLLAAGVYLAAMAVHSLPKIGAFADLTWNWQNKVLVIIALLLLVGFASNLTWGEIGVRRPERGWWVPVLAVSLGVLGLQLVIGPLAAITVNAESFLFQATLPGLEEELFFRGVLLLFLDRALRSLNPTGWRRVRWSAVISCALFGMNHGLEFGEGFALQFEPTSVIPAGLIGGLFVWIRIRWDSLLPAILVHNGWNSSIVVVNMLDQ